MSSGVPNTMVVEMKLSTSSPSRSWNGITTLSRSRAAGPSAAAPDSLQFLVQRDQFGVGGRLALAVQALEQMPAPFMQVDRARREPSGMQAEPHHVDRPALQQLRRTPPSSGVTMLLADTRFQCRSIASAGFGSCAFNTASIAWRADFIAGIIQRSLRERRRETAGDQHDVAFAQRNVEALGEPQHHVARRRGAAGFHEAQMPRGNLRVTGEIELAQVTALPPFAQDIADMDGFGAIGSRRGCMFVHGENLSRRFSRIPLRPR